MLLFLALFFLQSAKADDGKDLDLAWKTRLVAESHRLRSGFGQDQDRARVEEEVRGKLGPVSLLLTGVGAGQEARRPDYRIVANEVYADFAVDRNHFTLGKKILSADVGYGFRPIDVIQREQRLQVLPPVLTGVPNLAWERFSAESAWSLIYANPGHGRRGDAKADGSLSMRYYTRAGKADLHAVARATQRYGLEAGGAFSTVPNESLELHGSLLSIRHLENGKSAAKALGGFTWTFESGWSVIGEAWWDGAAAGRARRNALARVAWTDPAASGWSASFDLLRTIEDGGYSATAAIGYETDRLRLDAGVRRFGGKAGSGYRLLPERGVVFVGASLAF